MRSLTAALVVLGAALVDVPKAHSMEQCEGTAVMTGCVGDRLGNQHCVPEYKGEYVVTAEDETSSAGEGARFCLSVTRRSLCPNQRPVVTIRVNGDVVGEPIHMRTDSLEKQIEAGEGDEIEIRVALEAAESETRCIRLGSVEVVLRR